MEVKFIKIVAIHLMKLLILRILVIRHYKKCFWARKIRLEQEHMEMDLMLGI